MEENKQFLVIKIERFKRNYSESLFVERDKNDNEKNEKKDRESCRDLRVHELFESVKKKGIPDEW